VLLEGDEDEADAVSERLVEQYAGPSGALDVKIGGPGVGLGETIGEDLAKAEAIAVPITLVLLLLVFGGLIAALLPLAVGMISIFGTFLALFVVSLFADVSIFSINLTTALVWAWRSTTACSPCRDFGTSSRPAQIRRRRSRTPCRPQGARSRSARSP